MLLIAKNTLKKLFSDKVEKALMAITLILISFFVTAISGIIVFFNNQVSQVDKEGNAADAVFSLKPTASQASQNLNGLLGQVLIRGNFRRNVENTLPANFDVALPSLFSSIENLAWDDPSRTATQPRLANVGIGLDQYRVLQDGNTIFKIVPFNTWIQPVVDDTTDSDLERNDLAYVPAMPNLNYKPSLTNDLPMSASANVSSYWPKIYKTFYRREYQSVEYQWELHRSSSNGNTLGWWSYGFDKNGNRITDWPQSWQSIAYYFRRINEPILLAGREPTNSNEIDISYAYAHAHHLVDNPKYNPNAEITDNENDVLRIPRQPVVHIVGYATSPAFFYPQLNAFNLVPDNRNNAIVFTERDYYDSNFGSNFGTSAVGIETNVVLKVFGGNKEKFLSELGSLWRNQISKKGTYNNGSGTTLGNAFNFYTSNDSRYQFYNRTNFANSLVSLLITLVVIFGSFIGLIGVFIIFIVTRKKTQEDSKKIGVLKALGYKDIVIASSYMIVPTLLAGGATLLGAALGIIGWGLIINLLASYFNYDILNPFSLSSYQLYFTESWYFVVIGVLVPLIFAICLAFVVAYIFTRKKTTDLIYKSN